MCAAARDRVGPRAFRSLTLRAAVFIPPHPRKRCRNNVSCYSRQIESNSSACCWPARWCVAPPRLLLYLPQTTPNRLRPCNSADKESVLETGRTKPSRRAGAGRARSVSLGGGPRGRVARRDPGGASRMKRVMGNDAAKPAGRGCWWGFRGGAFRLRAV